MLVGPESDIPAPDVNTTAEIMAWIMDTLSMQAGYSVPASVTGKPLEIGGSEGRPSATGRGVNIIAIEACKRLGMEPSQTTVAVQGFGNVGSWACQLMHEFGIHHLRGFRRHRRRLLARRARHPGAPRVPAADTAACRVSPAASRSPTAELLELEVDVLVPAAMENQITARNAGRIQAQLIVEGANGPTTPDADSILERRGITVVPDILANAGGVTVSYFEWVQDLQSLFWEEDEINVRLKKILQKAFAQMCEQADRHHVSLRLGAYLVAVKRVADATAVRGIYP